MPDYFNEGYFVEKSAWHKMGRVVSAEERDAMTRADRIRAAGHDYSVVAVPNGNLERAPLTEAEFHALDTGHFALEDKGDEIAGLMRDFLERALP